MTEGMETSRTGRRRRAAAMPPAERRAAIIDATLPLLLEHGLAVTTRHIAEAAGIAEGTIFRAFPDKETLIEATVEAAIDPSATERALEAVSPAQPFEAQLIEATIIFQRRVTVIWRLFSVVGAKTSRPPARPPDSAALTALFARHDDKIRVSPAAAARRLRALTLASSHPALAGEPMSAPEIVEFFLDGVRSRGDAGAATETKTETETAASVSP